MLDADRPSQATLRPSQSPQPLPPAPRLLPPEKSAVNTDSVDLEVALPERPASGGRYRLRIYVNGELAHERRLPRRSPVLVETLPLLEGENSISAAISGPGGEGLPSAPLVVVRDEKPPPIEITSPADGEEVFVDQILLQGRTEAALRVIISNGANGEPQAVTADEEGNFEVTLQLASGNNEIALRTRDAAGNRSRATLSVIRAESSAGVTLHVSPGELNVESLPASVTLVARVQGVLGEPLDGAEVTFSISIPGQATSTYRTTSGAGGVAAWRGFRIPRDGARAGQGLVTVMAVLSDGPNEGLVVQESGAIRFR